STQRRDDRIEFGIETPHGSYKPALKYYLVKVHGVAAAGAGALKAYADADALQAAKGEGWALDHDRYGSVTLLRIAAGHARHIVLRASDVR
ncbi:MAG TPA: glycoside hydrolase family 31, partial [Dyella sp.]|nr:glycoside hydrolase family 31 [Dyella sp.]